MYKDHCAISRNTGERDEWDNVTEESVYTGSCDFQSERSNAGAEIIRTDSVYLPCIADIKLNDNVSITTRRGRRINGKVADVDHWEFDINGSGCTKLTLNQGREK